MENDSSKSTQSEKRHELNPSIIESIAAQSQKHKTPIIGFLVLCILALAGYLINSQYQSSYELKASEELFKAERLNSANSSMEKSLDETGMKKPEEKVVVDTTEVENKLTEVILEFPKSTAALQAGLTLSQIYQTKNNSQKALDTLESVLEKNPSKGVMGNSIRLKLSSYYEKGGDCEKALEALKPITDLKSEAFLKPEALLRTGLCYETLGKTDQAKQIYQKLATEHLDTIQGQQAQKYLKMLGANS